MRRLLLLVSAAVLTALMATPALGTGDGRHTGDAVKVEAKNVLLDDQAQGRQLRHAPARGSRRSCWPGTRWAGWSAS